MTDYDKNKFSSIQCPGSVNFGPPGSGSVSQMFSTVLWLRDSLSVKNDVNVTSERNKQLRKEQCPAPFVRGIDPRMRIRTEMSRIRNTAFIYSLGTISLWNETKKQEPLWVFLSLLQQSPQKWWSCYWFQNLVFWFVSQSVRIQGSGSAPKCHGSGTLRSLPVLIRYQLFTKRNGESGNIVEFLSLLQQNVQKFEN